MQSNLGVVAGFTMARHRLLEPRLLVPDRLEIVASPNSLPEKLAIGGTDPQRVEAVREIVAEPLIEQDQAIVRIGDEKTSGDAVDRVAQQRFGSFRAAARRDHCGLVGSGPAVADKVVVVVENRLAAGGNEHALARRREHLVAEAPERSMGVEIGLMIGPQLVLPRVAAAGLPAGLAEQRRWGDRQALGALPDQLDEAVVGVGLPDPIAADFRDVLKPAFAGAQCGLRLLDGGNVDAQPRNPPVGKPVLGDKDPASVSHLLLDCAHFIAVPAEPFRDPILLAAYRLWKPAQPGADAKDVLEADPGDHSVGGLRVETAIVFIADDQPVVLVIHDEAMGH